MSVEVRVARSHADIKSFARFPWTVYKSDPNWVPPLVHDRTNFLDRRRNPYFRHSDGELMMAYKGGRLAGTTSVHENRPHIEAHRDGVGFFGFFECVDDQEVADALFDTGSEWLRKRGYKTMRGPANFSINGEYSLLVSGFDSPPVVMMTYNPEYYPRLVEGYGFSKSQDMYAYKMFTDQGIHRAVMDRAEAVLRERPDIRYRKVDPGNFRREVGIFYSLYNAAWSENWGASKISEGEFAKLASEIRLVLDPEIAFIVEKDGKPIGFSLSIPDANQALRHANGRLLPFGLLKILWHKRRINAIRVLVMGLLKEHRHQGLDTVLYKMTYDGCVKRGYGHAEMSLINESNKPMVAMLEKIGAKVYKTYRMYDLALGH